MGSSRRPLGGDRAVDRRTRSTQAHRSQEGRPAQDAQRHHLPYAFWMPVEPVASPPWRRQHSPSHTPKVGVHPSVPQDVGTHPDPVRGVERRGLGMAVGGHFDGKSSFGGDAVGPNPTDRAKPGTKRSILVEASGRPLSVVEAGANVHDTKLLEATLESVVAERPAPTERSPQHLCLDKGYDNPTGHQTVARHGYQSHIRRIGEEKDTRGNKRYPARRWVVERTLGWLSKCRGILVRYEKKSENYLAMLQLACALLWYRHWWNLRF